MTESDEFKPTAKDLFLSYEIPSSELGLFLGCGASKEAGYPLTFELTKAVLSKLDASEIQLIDSVISKENIKLDVNAGYPDIEVINDLILKINVQSQDKKWEDIQKKIKIHIIDEFYQIKHHDLLIHRKLCSLIQKRSAGIASSFWIFTTNYDLLFEEAASMERLPLENGFVGTTNRYFDYDSIKSARGTLSGPTFYPKHEPTIRLFKLHGSLSWRCIGDKIYENCLSRDEQVLILPSRTKIIETLKHPYDVIFTAASQIIGSKCKYLICVGHSFRDDHINKNILIPKLSSGKIKILALVKDLTPEVLDLAKFQTFNYISEGSSRIDGIEYKEKSDLWRFSSFVNYIENKK